MRAAAERLAKMGFRVFPLARGAKAPPLVPEFFHTATTHPAQIAIWWPDGCQNNIAISTTHYKGGSLLVLDVDVKKDKDGVLRKGMESLRALEKEIGKLPETYTQHTPTAGLHIVFSCPEPLRQSVALLGEGLDTRAYHGYIVGSGSVIGLDGEYYDNGLPVAPAPPALLAKFAKIKDAPAQKRDRKNLEAFEGIADEDTIDHWRRHLRMEAEPGQKGNLSDSIYKLACRLRDRGIGENDDFQ